MPKNTKTIETLWKQTGFAPNSNQEEAIRHTAGPLYLPAGPGSGKTRVLLWRTLNLIVFQGIPPEEIYLSTFTEKAAHQLKEGLRALLAVATNETGRPYDLGRMYVGTIHSLCQKLILDRRFSNNRSRQQRPVLLDALSQYFYVSRSRRWTALTSGIGTTPEETHATINQTLWNNSVSKYVAVNTAISFFNRLSEEHLDPSVLLASSPSPDLIPLITMYSRYKDALQEGATVHQTDFSLLQQEAYNVLTASNGRSVFKHIIIDEYQDTNTIQEKLVFELARPTKNLCVVGDDDQALYRFRGATVENFVTFPQKCQNIFDQPPTIIPLVTNYRSRSSIVTLYSDFIQSANWADSVRPDIQYRVSKQVTAHRSITPEDTVPAVVASTPGLPANVCEEIAQLVNELLLSGKVQNPNQVAFLFPSLKTDHVARFKDALEKFGLKIYAPRAGMCQ